MDLKRQNELIKKEFKNVIQQLQKKQRIRVLSGQEEAVGKEKPSGFSLLDKGPSRGYNQFESFLGDEGNNISEILGTVRASEDKKEPEANISVSSIGSSGGIKK